MSHPQSFDHEAVRENRRAVLGEAFTVLAPKPLEAPKPDPNNKCDDCRSEGPTVMGLCGWCRRSLLREEDY